MDEAHGGELADDGLPGLLVDVLADFEDGETGVTEADDLVRRLAAQDVDDVAGAEGLARAVDGGERHFGRFGCIPRFSRGKAIVAVAAIAGMRFAEMGEDGLAAAGCGLADGEKRIELGALDAFDFFRCIALPDHAAALGDIAEAEGHPRFGGFAIATGAAGFLVVGFDRAGHVEVGDIADVRLVDAHAEGDGGDEGEIVFGEEGVLVLRADAGVHAGVIGQRADAFLVEPFGGLFDLAAGETVDDAALAFVAGEELAQLVPAVVAAGDRVGDVGAVEGGGEDAALFQLQALDDVGACQRICGGGERHAGHARKAFGDLGELAIFRAEVVAPLADAMRLVDGEEGDGRVAQHLLEAGRHQAFGGDVEQLQLAGIELVADVALFVSGQRGIEGGRLDALLAQGLDLVAHQGDQGRDNDGDAGTAEGRHLVAERLACAGGEQDDSIAPGDDMAHHLFLLAAEGGKAKDFAQDLEGVFQGLTLSIGPETLACARPLAFPVHRRYRAAPWQLPSTNQKSASSRWAARRRSSIQSASSRACAPRDTRSRPTTRVQILFL